MKKKFLIYKAMFLLTCSILSSCSSYMQNLYKQLDSDSPEAIEEKEKNRKGLINKYNELVPDSNLSSFNSSQVQKMLPGTKRQYRKNNAHQKAYNLYDDSNEGSLWAKNQNNMFLFIQNNKKKNGDMLIVNVQNNLKKEIAIELAKSVRSKKANKDNKDKKEEENKEENKEKKDETKEEKMVYDRIPSIIVKLLNDEYVLIRGKKDVLYQNRKRRIDLQALVARNVIESNSNIESNDLIETQITILK